MSDAPTSSRKPYHGSCHCGLTRYIVFMTLPPTNIHPNAPATSSVRIRKCNCTTCHKMGLFHLRLPSSPDDFLLLSPTKDFEKSGLRSYRCFEGVHDWLFCGTCGVRCFAFAGEGETVTVDLGALGVKGKDGEVLGEVEAWRPKKEGWEEGYRSYVSINATSLEAGQEGLDLREWHEKGWINYLDTLDEKEENRLGKPHRGGMY
ncbi:duf636 domain-containing protein [Rutstroemia sp. NJR-2017a BVV2]|nr:duf636 domain-containing protein [Rutstroemia sp. NJR-2017a BVV2]